MPAAYGAGVQRSIPYLLAGGIAGSALRWVAGELIASPISALLFVNTLGALILGVATAPSLSQMRTAGHIRLGLSVGFCGGLTTFSGLLVEIVERWQDGTGGAGELAGASLVLGLVALIGGRSLGRRLEDAPS